MVLHVRVQRLTSFMSCCSDVAFPKTTSATVRPCYHVVIVETIWHSPTYDSSVSRVHNGAVTLATSLHIVGIDPGRAACGEATMMRLFTAIIVNVLEVEGVYVTWNIAQNSQADVDQQVYSSSATL